MTAQDHEELIVDGEELSMAFCPRIPTDHPQIIDHYKGRWRRSMSTACWRGYIGTWEVKDGWFYLVRATDYTLIDGPVLADWFTGVLRIPRGRMLKYIHMGFATIFEEELHIKIEKGKVVKRRVIDNRTRKFDALEVRCKNLPGGENHFDGNDW